MTELVRMTKDVRSMEVNPENVSMFEGLGWSVKGKTITEKVKAFVAHGDEGSGKPGSEQWHKTQIAQMDSKEAVFAYVESAGKKIDKRDSLETIKVKALAVLNG